MAREDAAQFHSMLAFDKRAPVDDGYGNTVGGWVEQFQTHAAVTFLRGGETVMAARLESRSPAVIRLRASANAALLSGDWRARDMRNGTTFNIRQVTRDPTRSFVDCLAETGVVAG